jgi:hypothetical protein
MDNQHRQIKGYRDLSQAEIDLMNEIKALGPTIEALCDKIAAHVEAQHDACYEANDAPITLINADEKARLDRANPRRWLIWGRDGMQANLMYLTRAVAQPTFF